LRFFPMQNNRLLDIDEYRPLDFFARLVVT
jgi:hypothetical protein